MRLVPTRKWPSLPTFGVDLMDRITPTWQIFQVLVGFASDHGRSEGSTIPNSDSSPRMRLISAVRCST
jgi:hypothetical protein